MKMTSKANQTVTVNDLSAEIGQSAVDKLLNSISFPLTLVDINTPPPGNLLTKEVVSENEIILSESRVQKLLEAIGKVNQTKSQSIQTINIAENKFYLEALSNISETIESAKACLKTMEAPQTPKTPGQTLSSTDKTYLEAIVNGGVEGLSETTKGLKLKAICSDLKVIANNKPELGLNGSRVSISNSEITVKATGQLWSHIPSFRANRKSTNVTASWKWVRLASVSASITADLDAYIEIIVDGKILGANLHINRLRLDYPILREIPLEGIANRQLKSKLIPIFDAGSFIASIPVVNSRFGIESINLPAREGSIEIDIAIKQI